MNTMFDLQMAQSFEKVIADIGAGDGKQIYRLARKNPQNFYVGIEPNHQSYKQTEKKSKSKKEKGGLDNLIFVNSSIENISDELKNTFDELLINFPWGNLLEGVILPLPEILQNLVMIAKDRADLIIITTYDDKFEKEFKVERNLPNLNTGYINNILSAEYAKFGISIISSKLLAQGSELNIDSPWGKKLLSSRKRDVYKIVAQIFKSDNYN